MNILQTTTPTLETESTMTQPTVSRRGFGKRLLLSTSALALTAALSKTEEAAAAPLTDAWKLGGNDAVSTDGTNFIGTLNVAPLIFKVTKTAGLAPTERMRITPNGNVGIGTTTPAGLLHAKLNSTAPALLGENASTVANASSVLGRLTAAEPGVDAAAVLGENKGTNDKGVGVRGTHAGAGYGVYGSSANGSGVYGQGKGFGVQAKGEVYGVYATGAYNGVYGYSDKNGVCGSGALFGVVGITIEGTAVRGESQQGGITGSAVFGEAYGEDSNGVVGMADKGTKAYGIWGKSKHGYAGYFSGKVQVTGNLSKGGGSFKIDHPLDPANKYLYHSFVESPDMMNVYNGNIVLNNKGEATVQLPAYFGALNRDFRYQLTAIGVPGPNLYIAEKIANNKFKIAGGLPLTEVSWQVTGIRQDAFANANRIPVEEQKPESERGTYLHPTAHGKLEASSVDAERVYTIQAKNPRVDQIPQPKEPIVPGEKH